MPAPTRMNSARSAATSRCTPLPEGSCTVDAAAVGTVPPEVDVAPPPDGVVASGSMSPPPARSRAGSVSRVCAGTHYERVVRTPSRRAPPAAYRYYVRVGCYCTRKA